MHICIKKNQLDIVLWYVSIIDYAIITDMEPRLPTPSAGLERPHLSYGGRKEIAPSVYSPDNRIEQVAERHEELNGAASDNSMQPILPPPVVATTPSVVVQDNATTDDSSSGNPLVANDDDLIEKEWVDKAKRIILDTRDDPYRREREVGRLQADYLRKRYGRELGTPQY